MLSISITLSLNHSMISITLSLNHSMKYVCCWWRNQQARNMLLPLMKTFLLLLTKSSNARNFRFSLCFISFLYLCIGYFIFVFWPVDTTATNFQELTHSNPSKSTNQVTLSKKHKNHLFWAQSNLVHYRINPYFLLFIFFWQKKDARVW